jgi:large subunit ribosomal protein L17
MKHGVFGRKLGRSTAQRNGLRRTQIQQLLTHERIKTTEAKAKAIRGEVEKLVTTAKQGLRAGAADTAAGKARLVHARRLIKAAVNNDALTRKMFDTIAPRYEKRPGGYLRLYKIGPRPGDAAQMVLLEFVEE